jgi:predicted ATPase/class 3 adenylate cyclase
VRTELPTGTVTFLFTDVEGSTRLLHELGAEAYAAELAEHRGIVREACAGQGGVEVDTQGDAFFVAFPTAPGAFEAAAQITERLGGGRIRVRIGLHTGTPFLTDEGYAGADVNRAARIAASASGGQIVVSESTRALLTEGDFVDLGRHRFKDLAAAEHIYQLGSEEFPPLRSLPETNLPVPATPFLGREEELASVVTQLGAADLRLLTLTGAGGSGKTRLALQSAAEVAERFPGGVSWIPLSPLTDVSLVAPSVAQVLGAEDVPEGRLDLAFAERVSRGRVLVLVDNCEHLLPGVAQPIAALRDVAGVTVLATSRERLQLQGEQVFGVPPLSETDGVRLFVSRASAVGAQVSATAEVEELCERLDELPLALELAAARTVLFSPRQLLDRLGKRLDLLKGSRDLDPRQQTLRATIAWSHELLSPDERQLLRRLAVFRGACTFEAAEAVCDADPDTLQALLDKSLVRRREDDGERRYWMLETIREYALERLEESGEAEEIRRRHATHYAGDPLDVERFVRPDEAPKLLRRLNRELANVRGALDWAHQTRSPLELDLATLYQRADAVFPSEGRQRLEAALANPTPQRPRLRAHALITCGLFALRAGDLDTARRHSENALRLFRDLGDAFWEDRALVQLGVVAGYEGDESEEARLFDELAERARRGGDPLRRGVSLCYEGARAFSAGNGEEARKLFEQSLQLLAGAGAWEALGHMVLANLAIVQGRFDDAVRACAAGLEIAVGQARQLDVWWALGSSARALSGTNELEAAVRLHGAFLAWREARGQENLLLPSFSREVAEYEPAALRAATSDPEFARVAAEGRQMTLDDAIDCAREALARVAPRPNELALRSADRRLDVPLDRRRGLDQAF